MGYVAIRLQEVCQRGGMINGKTILSASGFNGITEENV